jgi:hypothetical protein
MHNKGKPMCSTLDQNCCPNNARISEILRVSKPICRRDFLPLKVHPLMAGDQAASSPSHCCCVGKIYDSGTTGIRTAVSLY